MTIDEGHGRIEMRRIQVRTVLPARLDEVWPGVKPRPARKAFAEQKWEAIRLVRQA